MRFTIFLAFLAVTRFSLTQNYIAYHNDCNRGAELIEHGEFSTAKDILLRAISRIDQPLAIDYFNLAKCYSQLKDSDSTLQFLELSLKLDPRTKNICSIHYLWFEPILGTDKWNEILNMDYYSPRAISKTQELLVYKISELIRLDQQYIVIQTDSISVYYPNDTALYNLYSDSIDFNQAIIQENLDSIISNYGWPGRKVTGQFTEDALLLIHVSDDWFETNRELLIDEINKGNLMPWAFADIADRKQHEHLEPLLYNGYFGTDDVITDSIRKNCEMIGSPLGRVRTLRAYYRMSY